jgi:hypothetical protein
VNDQSGNPLRTVWVLGAGFSRSLGGPLLPDLFRQEDKRDLEVRYPEIKYADLASACWKTQGLYNWGQFVEHQWTDAEQFIDFVDCAKPDSPACEMLMRMTTSLNIPRDAQWSAHNPAFSNLAEIQSSAVRALAAECSWFWRSALVQTERWAPYQAWLDALNPAFHTVVSFNYDGVLEKLSDPARHLVALPDARLDAHGGKSLVHILKLHGSVTWLREGNACRVVDVQEALASPGGMLAIGTPGQTKRMMKDQLFEPLWRKAEAAIRNAEAIVFLGYRFPESDGDARRRVLTAITGSTVHKLRIHVVLGPNVSHPDVLRVRHLLEVCTRQNRDLRPTLNDLYSVHVMGRPGVYLAVEPLLAEDYLALYGHDGPLSKNQ